MYKLLLIQTIINHKFTVFSIEYIHLSFSSITVLIVNNRDDDARIYFCFIMILRSFYTCRHGALLIPILVIKSFAGKSRIEYARYSMEII